MVASYVELNVIVDDGARVGGDCDLMNPCIRDGMSIYIKRRMVRLRLAIVYLINFVSLMC